MVAHPDPVNGGVVIFSATQVPHFLKEVLALTNGIPENKIRAVAPDVGGGFGSKLNVYAEEILAVALARRLGVPIKFVEDRTENYLATIHGRDQVQDIELAATSEGRILGMKVDIKSDMGAYLQLNSTVIPLLGAFMYCGVYTFDAYSFECTGVFTNKTPTDAYRGAGRPEAAFAIERMMDLLALELGMSPVEVRRKNFYEPFDEPTTTPAGIQYDSMNIQPTLDRAIELAGTRTCAPSSKAGVRTTIPCTGIGFSTTRRSAASPPPRSRSTSWGCRSLGYGYGEDARLRQGRSRDRLLAARAGARDLLVADRGRCYGRVPG